MALSIGTSCWTETGEVLGIGVAVDQERLPRASDVSGDAFAERDAATLGAFVALDTGRHQVVALGHHDGTARPAQQIDRAAQDRLEDGAQVQDRVDRLPGVEQQRDLVQPVR